MNRTKSLFAISFIGCLLLPVWATGQAESIPSAQAVIKAYVNALGGVARLQNLETVAVSAKSDSVFGDPRKFDVLWKKGKFLVEETETRGARGKRYVHQIGFDGANEWVNRAGQPPRMTGHSSARSLNTLETFGVTPYALQLLSFTGVVTQNGKQEIDGRATWHLIFEWPSGQQDHRFFDTESGLLVCAKTGRPPGAKGGFGGGPPTRFFRWHVRQGNGLIKLKESIVVTKDSPALKTQVDSVVFNSEIDNTRFSFPDDSKTEGDR